MTAMPRLSPSPCTDSPVPVRSDVLVQNFDNVHRLRPIDYDMAVKLVMRWLHQNFRNPEHVAQVFHVRNSTACNWWRGDHQMNGQMVMRVFLDFPAAFAFFMAERGTWEDQE